MQLKNKKVVEPYDLWTNLVTSKEKKAKKLHPSTKRNKKAPLPHPGQSYNPHPEDHKRLLKKVADEEVEYQKKQASLRRALNVRVDAKELRDSETKDLVSGLEHLIQKEHHTNEDSDGSLTDDAFEGYDNEDFAAILKNKTVKEKRKSRQQRLRQLKDKLQRKAAKLRKSKNIRMSKFDAIKKITKELDKKDKEEAKKKKKHRKLKTERFGQKFEQSDPIYCLSDELPSNLLKVSCPMDKIVREQLENFQSRLMVEPTSLQMKKRKFKKKVFDRKIAAEQEG